MLYSQSCEYAIRALSYLALQPKGKFSPVQEIAKHQKIPKYFLGKLLQMLAKRGLVESTRGPGGGWTIKPKATQISLLKIVECTDGLVDLERCLLGLGMCSQGSPTPKAYGSFHSLVTSSDSLCENPCSLHEKWQPIKETIIRFLKTETLAELAAPIKTARKREESVK